MNCKTYTSEDETLEKSLSAKKTWIALSILLLASFLRLYDLGNAPLFFDESVHAAIMESVPDSYRYNPAFHGPLHYYTVAPVAKLLGTDEFSLRLVPAILGILFVASIFLYRRYLGDRAYIAAFLVAISPIIVNYSRFYREDVYVLLFTSLGLYFYLRYLEFENSWKEIKLDRSTVYFILFSVFMSLFAAVKETFYVFAAMLSLYSVFLIKRIRLTDLALGAAVFFAIYLTLFSVFWRVNVLSFEEFPMVKAVSYWYSQHASDKPIPSGPPLYYVILLLLYDAPAAILAMIAVYGYLKKSERSEFTTLFVYLFLANFLFFTYMREKAPWLAVHIEFPMFMLAAKAANKKSLVIAAVFLLYGCIAVNFANPINYAEPALYLPTTYETREFASKIGENDTVYFIMDAGEAWPAAWYVKAYTGKYPYILKDCQKVHADVIVSTNESCARSFSTELETFPVRCWPYWTDLDTWLDPGIIHRLPKFLLFRTSLSEKVYCTNYSVAWVAPE